MQNCAGDPQIPEQVCLVIVFNWHNWLNSLGDHVTRAIEDRLEVSAFISSEAKIPCTGQSQDDM